jgi:HSP20 family protein
MAREESKEMMRREQSMVSPMEDMERLFETMMGRPFFAPLFRRSQLLQEMAPSIDVFEEGNEVVVRAEIPGMKKDQIEVNLTEDTITLSGEKRQEQKVERKDFYRQETSYGSFTRTIRLPCEVETEKAQAKYQDGILEIRVSKTQAAREKVKKLTIQ